MLIFCVRLRVGMLPATGFLFTRCLNRVGFCGTSSLNKLWNASALVEVTDPAARLDYSCGTLCSREGLRKDLAQCNSWNIFFKILCTSLYELNYFHCIFCYMNDTTLCSISLSWERLMHNPDEYSKKDFSILLIYAATPLWLKDCLTLWVDTDLTV